MLFLLWSILSLGRAVEGLDVVIQSPTSLQSLNDPWTLQIAHQFGYNRLCIKMALGPISPSQMFYYSALLFNTR